jgi:hypothetical protein
MIERKRFLRKKQTPETNLTSAIKERLGYLENSKELYFIRNNTGATKVGARFFQFGRAGTSDFIIFMRGGRTIFLEAKAGKNTLNDNQKEFKAKIEGLGYEYEVIKDINYLDQIIYRRREKDATQEQKDKK